MSSLLGRKVEPELAEQLRRHTGAHARSPEAEHRAALRDALTPALHTGADILALLRGDSDLDLDPDEVRVGETGRAADFGDK